MTHPYLKIFGLVLTLFAITGIAFYLATLIVNDPELQRTVQSFGFLGMILVAFVTSLNAFIPIPPATFAPLFLSAGASHLVVIICFTIGSSLADSIGFLLGWLGRNYTADHHPGFTAKLTRFFAGHQTWILPATYLYMSFSPFPNEYIMIPLALVGFKYKQLLLPLLLGNLFHHTWMVYGYESIFEWLF